MLTRAEKLRFLALMEERSTKTKEISFTEEELLERALMKVDDTSLRLEIDSLMGNVILEYCYRAYEIGREVGNSRRHRRGHTR